MLCFLFSPSSLVSTSRSVPRETCNTEPASQSFFFADFNFLRLRPRASSTRRRRLLPEGVVLAGVRPAHRHWELRRGHGGRCAFPPHPRASLARSNPSARARSRVALARAVHPTAPGRRVALPHPRVLHARHAGVPSPTAGTLLARASLAPPRLTPSPRTDPPAPRRRATAAAGLLAACLGPAAEAPSRALPRRRPARRIRRRLLRRLGRSRVRRGPTRHREIPRGGAQARARGERGVPREHAQAPRRAREEGRGRRRRRAGGARPRRSPRRSATGRAGRPLLPLRVRRGRHRVYPRRRRVRRRDRRAGRGVLARGRGRFRLVSRRGR